MKIEANTLQEAFQKAAEQLNCSVTELDIKVLQHPSGGIFGFFKKTAIIEANLENQPKPQYKPKNDRNFAKKSDENESVKEEKKQGKKHDHNDKKRNPKKHKDEKNETKSEQKEHKNEKPNLSEKNSALAKDAFAEKGEKEADEPGYVIKRLDEPKEQKETKESKEPQASKTPKNILDTSIIENFNQTDEESSAQNLPKEKKEKVVIDFDAILPEIKDGVTRLFKASCFEIDKIEVSKFNDETLLVELDGADAALLIGKEGYRYKAISYMLYNWLNSKYNLAIRLEIAQFLQNQESMMDQYLNGVIERVQNIGRAQTKPLDGVLVKIALEKLREKFPDKYVGIKSGNDGKFVVVNDFFKK